MTPKGALFEVVTGGPAPQLPEPGTEGRGK
jgi:hypothetical protein